MLTMEGHIDTEFNSTPKGGVWLVRTTTGDYTGPGGTWQDAGEPTRSELKLVNIQQASPKSVEPMMSTSGAFNPQDWRVIHLNDGTLLSPDDSGEFADLLEFSDGLAMRQWRVRQCDNRPWRSYCRAIVERYRGAG